MRKTRMAWMAVVPMALLSACGGTATTEDGDGLKTDHGVTSSEIRIGLFNGFTGPIAAGAIAAATGFDARLAKANDEGGICERKLVSVRGDTEYDPAVAVQVYRQNKQKVVMLGEMVGTDTLLTLSKQIDRDDILTLGATSSEEILPLENIFLFTTPFPYYVINGLVWAAEHQASPGEPLKFGVVYQDDTFGQGGLHAAEYAAESMDGLDLVASAGYGKDAQDFTPQILKLKSAGAETVWIHGVSSHTALFMTQAAQLGYKPQWITVDSGYTTNIAEQLGDLVKNLHVVTSAVSFGEDLPATKELKRYADKVAPGEQLSQVSVVGWINASVAVEALRAACEEQDLTQQGVLDAMDGLVVETGGLGPTLKYDEEPYTPPSTQVRINKIDPATGELAAVTDFESTAAADNFDMQAFLKN